MAELKTDFKNDILDSDMGGRRRYEMVTNSDGTVSFIDKTIYTQVGDNFDANTINGITESISENLTKVPIYNPTDDYLYIGGVKWKKAFLQSNYIFKDGQVNETLTNGLSANGYSMSGVASTSVGTIGSVLTLASSTDYASILGSNSSIDLTNLNTLKVIAKGVTAYNSNYGFVYVTNSKTLQTSANVQTITSTSETTYNIDISSFNGSYYIAFGASNGRKCEIIEVELS